MDWKIITNSNEVSGGLDIILTPKNEVLRFSILQFKPINLVELLNNILNSETAGIEYATIYNLKEMDWEDKAWAKRVKGNELKEGELFLVHDITGEAIIEENIFCKILYDYCKVLLGVHKEDKDLPQEWFLKMEESLVNLKQKIDIENPDTRSL